MPFALQNRALFERENRAKRCPEKGGGEEGWPVEGAKRKKGRVKTGQLRLDSKNIDSSNCLSREAFPVTVSLVKQNRKT